MKAARSRPRCGTRCYDGVVATLSFEQARECVLLEVAGARPAPQIETVALTECAGRVLASDAHADRDYPPTSRSVRDGFAVRAADLPGRLRIAGEVRAGEHLQRALAPGEAIEIMTGAPVPAGADAIVMVEHTRTEGEYMITSRATASGEFINPRGSECRQGDVVVPGGRRLTFADVAMLASIGQVAVPVYVRPGIAIIPTGDEIVEAGEQPLAYQVRNSNSYSLAAQASRAGGCPRILPVARDNYDSTRRAIERGLGFDLLLLSGGVSAGKYDIVERVLADLGAEFFFDRVLIQPGQPLVFGRARGTFFFGLPGNPASTMVTFELFARAAAELLGGDSSPRLPLLYSRLAADFRHKPGLTRFLPAELSADGAAVTPIAWLGSSDLASLARAGAFLVADAGRESWSAGELIRVLLK